MDCAAEEAATDEVPAEMPDGRILDIHARRQAAILAFGRRTNARPCLNVLMQDAVALLAEVLAADISSTGQVAGDMLVLEIVGAEVEATAGKPLTHRSPLRPGDSLSGYALGTASPVVSRDIVCETRFTDLFLCNLGVRAALCVPLHSNKDPFGTLGVYLRRPHEFTPEDLQFAETISLLLANSIARVMAEEALHQELAFGATLMAMLDAPVIVLSPDGKAIKMNRACEEITGFALEDVRGRPFASVFMAAEDVDSVRNLLRDALRNRVPRQFECSLLTKRGQQRRAQWSLCVTCDPSNDVQAIVLYAAIAAEPGQESALAGRPAGPELRASPRLPYQYRQLIAPMYHDRVPKPEDFFEVVCVDLSAGGLSFHTERVPDFKRLVVALGKPPAVSYFIAEVVRVGRKTVHGKQVHVVGCRFMGRVRL